MEIKWALLYSGWGNSVLKCIDMYASGQLKGNQIACIVSIGQESPVPEKAKNLNIETIEKRPGEFNSIEQYQEHITKELKLLQIDYIFLQGYKYRIRKYMLQAFPNRIINIHPSLLPAFKNTQKAIQDAIDYGVKVSGSTTHIIDDHIDEGIILRQKSIEIGDGDTFESLYPKFMEIGEKLICETYAFIKNNHQPGKYLSHIIKKIPRSN